MTQPFHQGHIQGPLQKWKQSEGHALHGLSPLDRSRTCSPLTLRAEPHESHAVPIFSTLAADTTQAKRPGCDMTVTRGMQLTIKTEVTYIHSDQLFLKRPCYILRGASKHCKTILGNCYQFYSLPAVTEKTSDEIDQLDFSAPNLLTCSLGGICETQEDTECGGRCGPPTCLVLNHPPSLSSTAAAAGSPNQRPVRNQLSHIHPGHVLYFFSYNYFSW